MFKNFLKKIYISKQFSYLAEIMGSPWKGKGAILMYHRVLPDEKINEDLNIGLAVPSSVFEKQIKALIAKYKLCTMDEFISGLRKDKNEFKITITFDDGYKDNLLHALPILEKFNVPASIYITTSFLKEEVNLWWLELMETIQNNPKINFQFENKYFNLNLNNQKKKLLAYSSLREIFLNLKIDKQNEFIEIITKKKQRKNYSDLCLNKEELKILDKHKLITIGSHSHNHLNFNILNTEEIKFEVNKSLKILENLLDHKIEHFCYPYGGQKQASDREYKIIEELNFSSAVTGRVYPINKSDLFSLPRIYIGKNVCDKAIMNHTSGFYNLVSKFI